MTLTATAEALKGSGAEDGPGGAAAGRDATSGATNAEGSGAREGGSHGAVKRERKGVP